MHELRYTLLSDGSSDRALIPILTWLLRDLGLDCAIEPQWAGLGRIKQIRKDSFEERIRLALDLYPCELLFIHRDAEKESHAERIEEIRRTIKKISIPAPTICVVPVRMTEAWLLCDLYALRRAADNPNGKVEVQLPPIREIEKLPDPKEYLYNLLRKASELSGRRLKKFPVADRVHRIAETIESFESLRTLSAFAALESELNDLITQQKWKS